MASRNREELQKQFEADGRYRKRSIVIEAFQMTKERRWDNSEWPSWLHMAWTTQGDGALWCNADPKDNEQLFLSTLESTYEVSWGDWIIQGINGELYPCKPDIFLLTYEAVE